MAERKEDSHGSPHEVFPGCLQMRYGYLYPNEQPGLGIDLDEQQAARYPCTDGPPSWTLARARWHSGLAVRFTIISLSLTAIWP